MGCRDLPPGNNEVADYLDQTGADTGIGPVDAFIGACMNSDLKRAEEIAANNHGLRDSLTDDDKKALPNAAWHGKTGGVSTLLKAGFDVDALGEFDATALHLAAFNGDFKTVAAIMPFNPPLDDRRNEYGGTPMGWALHAAMNMPLKDGNYPGVVAELIKAGSPLPDINFMKNNEVFRQLLLDMEKNDGLKEVVETIRAKLE